MRAAHGELLLSFFFSVLHLFLNFFFFSSQVLFFFSFILHRSKGRQCSLQIWCEDGRITGSVLVGDGREEGMVRTEVSTGRAGLEEWWWLGCVGD